MELTADQGLVMNVYSPEPGTASQESLGILASWSATLDHRASTSNAKAD
jgi:hypothetical protein